MKLERFDLVGCSIGGWIAADMATKSPERVRRLVLVGPVGVKVGPVDKLDIPDIFAMPRDKLNALLYHDPRKRARPRARCRTRELHRRWRATARRSRC